MSRVFSTEEFDNVEKTLPAFYQLRIEAFIKQLKKSSQIGQPLGYSYFREKKMDKFRLYFLVYDELDSILLVTISSKKTQQKTINEIKENLDSYNEIIKKKINAL